MSSQLTPHLCSPEGHVTKIKTAYPRGLPSFGKRDYRAQTSPVAHQRPVYQEMPPPMAGGLDEVLREEGSASCTTLPENLRCVYSTHPGMMGNTVSHSLRAEQPFQ